MLRPNTGLRVDEFILRSDFFMNYKSFLLLQKETLNQCFNFCCNQDLCFFWLGFSLHCHKTIHGLAHISNVSSKNPNPPNSHPAPPHLPPKELKHCTQCRPSQSWKHQSHQWWQTYIGSQKCLMAVLRQHSKSEFCGSRTKVDKHGSHSSVKSKNKELSHSLWEPRSR